MFCRFPSVFSLQHVRPTRRGCGCVCQGGLARIKSNLASRVKKGKMTQEAADAVFARVKGTLDYNDFGSVDMVCLPCSLLSVI